MPRWWGVIWKSKLLWSYFFDLVLIGLVFLPYPFLISMKPTERKVWLDDRSIQYPFSKTEHFPSWSLPIVALVIPATVILVWIIWKKFENRTLLVSFIGLLLALALTVTITNFFKVAIGELRPDFLARCDPDPQIVNQVVCRGNPKRIANGRKSFPSGHSSSSFAGLGYLSFFLAGQLALYDGTGYVYRFVLVLAPILLASYVGATRVVDYRHHCHDVFAGATLGLLLAYLSYRLYFPPIMRVGSDIPYENRQNQLLSETEQEPLNQRHSSGVGTSHSERLKNKSISFADDVV